MVWYTHGPVNVYDARPGQADRILQNGTGGQAVLVKDGAAQPIRDLNTTPLDQITSNSDGQTLIFQVESRYCLVQFGDIVNPSWGVEVAAELANQDQVLAAAQNAVAAAQQAVANAQAALATAQASGGGGAGDWATLLNKPTTFPPDAHTHPSGQISDSTATGRAVLGAVDAQAARAAIGAGTGNGTSNLTLGSTATTAAAGNHSHTASSLTFVPFGSITGTDVQTAIQQAALSGGGSGTSAVYVWRYSAGGWPTLPTTQPAGVLEVRALGPTYPTTIPTWIGLGASQVPMSYSKVNVA